MADNMKRRQFLTGLLAAPVVITTPGLLMPVRALEMFEEFEEFEYPIFHVAKLEAVGGFSYRARALKDGNLLFESSVGHVFYHGGIYNET